MTELEHAIKHIKTRADAWAVKEVTEALQSISERLDKALSQEPCDDAISINAVDRFGVLNEIYEWTISGEYEQPRGTDILIKRINNIPSVTQKSDEQLYKNGFADGYEQGRKDAEPKSGKWIAQEGWDGDVYYECSVCGEPFCLIEGTPTDNMYNYCPNCGAKMGSEDKE